jgi:phosphoglycolate phosphatase
MLLQRITHSLKRLLGHREPPSSAPRDLKLILFDFDGTLADTFEAGFRIFQELAPEWGCRTIERSELPALRTMRPLELMRSLNIPLKKIAPMARRWSAELQKQIDDIAPFPGTKETLHQLTTAGFRLGILTSNTQSNVSRFLTNHDMEVFEFIRGSSRLLGKAREIRALLKKHRLHRNEVMLVGDETRDIEAARQAGIPVTAVSWGYAHPSALAKMQPDLLINKPTDLLPALHQRATRHS